MKSAIITILTAVSGLFVCGLIGYLINRHSGKRTGGSFRETFEDNEPQNLDEFDLKEMDEAYDYFFHFDWAAECM